MKPVYVIIRSAGMYEDFRTFVIGYSGDKKSADKVSEKALKEARKLQETKEKIWKNFDFNGWQRNENPKMDAEYDRRNAKEDKLKSKLDPTLSSHEFSEATYEVQKIERIK